MSCHICDGIAGPRERFVYEDEHWAAYRPIDVPGWVMLATKEHVEGTWNLTDAQAADFGRIARDASAAVKKAVGADRVHLVYLGETARHFHAGLFPVAEGRESLFANDRLLAAVKDESDAAAAAEVGAAIKAALDEVGS